METHVHVGMGSIPACAGEPGCPELARQGYKVYPRVCGGTEELLDSLGWHHGLSPRVRGNQRHKQAAAAAMRSIPACAGEPEEDLCKKTLSWVYPRVCGGTWSRSNGSSPLGGLSPRVRGNQSSAEDVAFKPRSIPACAGEPGRCPDCQHLSRVYPRVCGGTVREQLGLTLAQGLSPRVRGNLQDQPRGLGQLRSIPACAGEPPRPGHPRVDYSVYPRVCGGTSEPCESPYLHNGLSPRVRGNHPAHQGAPGAGGSIPACAGGTIGFLTKVFYGQGLSPRVRGNPGYT